MRRFIIYIFLLVFISLIVLELVCRLFNLSGDIVLEANVGGDRLLKPNSEFVWVRGNFKEINSHVEINNIGFNCSRDSTTEFLGTAKKIALVGDSFIEGFHVDSDRSIGSLLEERLVDEYQVYEFGKSDGNFNDFREIYDKYRLAEFDFVFIFISTDNLFINESAFMGKGNQISSVNLIKKMYDRIHFIRYLNYNYKIFQLGTVSDNSLNRTYDIEDINVDNLQFLSLKHQNIVFIPKQELDNVLNKLIASLDYPILNIKHTRKPIDFGYDVHWNENGRLNAAESVVDYIEGLH